MLQLDYAAPSLTQIATFVDILGQRARQQPEQKAYTFLHFGKQTDTSLTYGELDQQARSIAARLQERGYAGKLVLLLYPSGLEYIAAFLGCLYAGAIAVPLYPPHSDRSLPRIQAIIDDTRSRVVLTTHRTRDDILRRFPQLPALQHLHWLATDTIPAMEGLRWQQPDLCAENLAFLQYTSGSTASPKGVMVSHGNLVYNSQLFNEQMTLGPGDRGVSWLPIFHDLGLIMGILQPLFAGYHTALMAPAAFLQHPLRWLETMSEQQATVTYAPNFAYDLCLRRSTPAERERLDLRHWQIALNGAEPVREQTLRAFRRAFADCGFHPDTFLPAYGLAEATLVVSSGQRRQPTVVRHVDKTLLEEHTIVEVAETSPQAQALVSCGRSMPGQRILIVDPQTRLPCPPQQVGEIWVAGQSMAQGYLDKQEESGRTFQACLAESGEGPFLRTGDLGFMQDGELFITGRLKDLIILQGRNHYPQDIEYTVEQSSPVIRAGYTAAFSIDHEEQERLVVVAEVRFATGDLTPQQVRQTLDEAQKAVRRNIAQVHEVTVHQVAFVTVGEVSKTSSGKLQRQACRTRFLAGTLQAWER